MNKDSLRNWASKLLGNIDPNTVDSISVEESESSERTPYVDLIIDYESKGGE